jgi:hypothetical protein
VDEGETVAPGMLALALAAGLLCCAGCEPLILGDSTEQTVETYEAHGDVVVVRDADGTVEQDSSESMNGGAQ